MTTAIDKTFRIPARNLDALSKAVNHLNSKADDLGMDPIGLQVLDKQKDIVAGRLHKYVKVRLIGEAPQIEGYQLVGRINHRRDETDIIRTVSGNLPDKYRDRGNICDHCGYKRFRKATYVLHELDQGEHLQVGSTCVKDFTGGHSVEQIAKHFSKMLDTVEQAGTTHGTANFEDPDYLYYDLETYMAAVVHSVYRYEWVSKTKAVSGCVPTFYRAQQVLKDPEVSLTYAEKKRGLDIIKWGLTLPEDGTDDFLHNVRAICVADEVHVGDLPYAAAAYTAFCREGKQKDSEHVAKVGQRRRFRLKLVHTFSYDTRYGPYNGFKFEDDDGNVLVWKTQTQQDLRRGNMYGMEATVKDHSEYNGVKQTILSRCWID